MTASPPPVNAPQVPDEETWLTELREDLVAADRRASEASVSPPGVDAVRRWIRRITGPDAD